MPLIVFRIPTGEHKNNMERETNSWYNHSQYHKITRLQKKNCIWNHKDLSPAFLPNSKTWTCNNFSVSCLYISPSIRFTQTEPLAMKNGWANIMLLLQWCCHTACTYDGFKSERTQWTHCPWVSGTHRIFPWKTIHCEQLVLKISDQHKKPLHQEPMQTQRGQGGSHDMLV